MKEIERECLMNTPQQMLQHLQVGDLDNAKKTFQKILKNGSDEEQFQLAEELYHLGFLEETKQLYEQLLTKYPDEGELKVLLAETLVDMDQEDAALEQLEQIPENDPVYPRALVLLADLYQSQGLFEVSEQKLLRAQQLLPNEPVIQFALAELYASQGRHLEAIRHYEQLLENGETEIAGTSIHHRLADTLSAGGAFEEALPYYEKALDERLEINTLFGYAFTAYQAGYYKLAIEKFTELKELDPEYHSLYLYLAKAYEHEELLEKSVKTIEEGLKFNEFNKELLAFGGKIAMKLNNLEKAEHFFRQALVIDPSYLEAALQLNRLLLHQERYEEIVELVEMVEKEGEHDPQLDWDMAVSLQEVEQYEQALKRYQQAYTFFKNHPEFLNDFGQFLLEEGMLKEAYTIYQQLLQQDPTNEEYIMLVERLQEDTRMLE
jgi:tetratricopeptide (TPR) repeat protein